MAAVEKGGVTISVLQGLGGVGKTALALKLAAQFTPRVSTSSLRPSPSVVNGRSRSKPRWFSSVVDSLEKAESQFAVRYNSNSHGRRDRDSGH